MPAFGLVCCVFVQGRSWMKMKEDVKGRPLFTTYVGQKSHCNCKDADRGRKWGEKKGAVEAVLLQSDSQPGVVSAFGWVLQAFLFQLEHAAARKKVMPVRWVADTMQALMPSMGLLFRGKFATGNAQMLMAHVFSYIFQCHSLFFFNLRVPFWMLSDVLLHFVDVL